MSPEAVIEMEDKAARDMIKRVKDIIPYSSDSAAKSIAEEGERRLKRELYRQGRIVSAQGVNSLETKKIENNDYAVIGLKRLIALDRGAEPHWPPLDNRIRKGARMYGISTYFLRKTIAEKGTKPHPFISRALSPLKTQANDIAGAEFKDYIGDAT